MIKVNTLLPQSKITVFSQDAQTRKTIESIAADWRYARAEVQVESGDIKTAIELYKSKTSPDLLILQTDEINDGLPALLEELATYCAQNTSCLLIGPTNDVQLYRKLTQMGVSDYLVAPISVEDMITATGSILLDKHGHQDSQLICLLGSTGGNGTTTISQILAEGLSQFLDQKTLLLDAAGAWGDLHIALNYEPTISLHELIEAAKKEDEDALKRMIFEVMPKLHVAGTGAQKLLNGSIEAKGYEAIIDMMLPQYPNIVVDLSTAPEAVKSLMVKRASKLILVTEPNVGALRVTRLLIKEIKTLRGGSDDQVNVVLSKQGQNKEQEVNEADIKTALGKTALWHMPYLPKLMATRDMQGKKMTEIDEGKKLAHQLIEKLLPNVKVLQEKKTSLMDILGLKKTG
ncbi:MAG: hypothetical protein CMH30_06600 [Micavibrio sp.]|nr:hypothetical protein [Micavibrio sp.]|tara:strand:- start:2387 stop:3595 length:1209 start_codon:yes stop_codon:yes gene_type:complete